MMNKALTQKVKLLPKKPGIYQFLDKDKQILYVGKAINLRSRVSSYFSDTHIDRPWIRVMMDFVADVETIVVTNELEALMLEATQIKQHQPKFNIKLTDDKAYPYIKVSLAEPVARFSVIRRQINDKATYFGPYLSARSATNTLEFLRSIYGIHLSPTPLRFRQRACFSCQLEGFPCVLANECSVESYNERVKKAIEFLQGKRKQLIHDAQERMHNAATNQQFELAAKLRDQLQAMQQVSANQNVIQTSLEDFDVIGICQNNQYASVVVMTLRDGRITGQHSFSYMLTDEEQGGAVIRQFLVEVYANFTDLPRLIVLPTDIDERKEIEALLRDRAGHAIELRIAVRGDKKDVLELANKNAQNRLETRLLKTNQAFNGVIALQELLHLPALPHRIEAVDISNLGTSEAVSATVCFIDGQSDKNEYRRYKIKTVEGQNDFAMIREVTHRRFSDTSRPVPDLFVVDGGPQQLKFALEALAHTPLQPKHIISLAKKPDRIFLPGRKLPIPAPKGNKGLQLLSRVRDEVHRFGINYQRARQLRKSLQSKREN